jgi:cytochrome c oxidase cbb3-type subunit 3
LKKSILIPLLLAALLSAQEESSQTVSNPFNTPADRENGARVFRSQCAACHGLDGRGGQGTPDFTTGRFRRASSDEGLFQIIGKGIPGTTMPAFSLNARDTWSTLAYIRSLSAGRATAGSSAGDAVRGRELFRSQGCARCHVDGAAPDLTGIGRFQSVSEIRRSIVEPQADVPPQYFRIRATTKAGAAISGTRLNEDTYSVQYRDANGLKSVMKSSLAAFEIIRTSPMPTVKLTDAQVNDLLAFLMTGESR